MRLSRRAKGERQAVVAERARRLLVAVMLAIGAAPGESKSRTVG